MLTYIFDEVSEERVPPTRESIEQARIKQLQALQALRRRLIKQTFAKVTAEVA